MRSFILTRVFRQQKLRVIECSTLLGPSRSITILSTLMKKVLNNQHCLLVRGATVEVAQSISPISCQHVGGGAA